MSRSQHPYPSNAQTSNQPSVTPPTSVVNNAHSAPQAPRPELRSAPIEPHWELVIDRATD